MVQGEKYGKVLSGCFFSLIPRNTFTRVSYQSLNRVSLHKMRLQWCLYLLAAYNQVVVSYFQTC